MLVLMPDAMVEDDALIEREVLGGGTEVALHQELVADRIPDHRWRAADALIAYYGVPIDRALIERLDNCRIVVRAGVGYDHIDIAACGRRGIPVCNVPDYGTTEVADHAIALILASPAASSRTTPGCSPIRTPAGTGRGRRSCVACAARPSAWSASGGSAPPPPAARAASTWR